MQSTPFQSNGGWVIPTRPVVTNDEGYIINAVGTQYDWDFRGSASMPRGDPSDIQQYFSVTQVNGPPTYTGAEEGALAWDYTGRNLYVFDGTIWVLVDSGGGVQNLSQTLAIGNVTGVNDIVVSASQSINFVTGVQIGGAGGTATASLGSVAIGNGADASGTVSTAIGNNSTATGVTSFAIGNSAAALGFRSFAFGNNTSAGAANGNVVIGNVSVISGDLPGQDNRNLVIGNQNVLNNGLRTILIGDNINSASAPDTIAIGSGVGTGPSSVIIGSLSNGNTIAGQNVIVGAAASCAFEANVAIGYSATCSGTFGMALGWGANSLTGGIAIGARSVADSKSIAIGADSVVEGSGNIAIGDTALAFSGSTNCICIGAGAIVTSSTNGCYLGINTLGGLQTQCSVIGTGNVTSPANQLHVYGTNNTIGFACDSTTVIGSQNTISNPATQNFVGGNNNIVEQQDFGVIIGYGNQADSIYNVVIGWTNEDHGDGTNGKNTCVGSFNRIMDDLDQTTCVGSSNLANWIGTYLGRQNDGGDGTYADPRTGLALVGNVNVSNVPGAVIFGNNNQCSIESASPLLSNRLLVIGSNNDCNSTLQIDSVVVGFGNRLQGTHSENMIIGVNNEIADFATNVTAIGHDIEAISPDCYYFTPNLPSYSSVALLGYDPSDGRVSWVIGSPSSRRWKEEIQPFTGYHRVLDLEVVQYRWKKGRCTCVGGCDEDPCCQVSVGMIAEDVAEILPEIVHFYRDGSPCDKSVPKVPQSLDYARIGAYLVPVVREQRDKIAELTARIEVLESKPEPQILPDPIEPPDYTEIFAKLTSALEAQQKEIASLSREVFQLRSKVFS